MLPYGRKILCRSPFFEAVTALRFSPDYLTRERQEFKEEGKPQVSLPFCPCGGRRSLPRSAERNSPLRFSEKTPAHQGRTACAVRVPRSAGAEKLPPVRGEPAYAVRVPRSAGAEKLPPVRGEPPAQFAYPAQPEQKRSRPSGANSLTQFACPGQPVLKRSRPSGANPPAQFACPRGSVPENKVYPLTNPDLTAIILKLIHKCREKEEYFSFARLERVRSVQAPRRGRRRSLWSRTAEFSLSCSV